MNLDNEEDYRELSTTVHNYLFVEFVAVPPDFDIDIHLTLRENVGLFDNDKVRLGIIEKIVEGIKHSPVVNMMNNALLDPITGVYLLSILDELGLIVRSIPNPIRQSQEDYKDFVRRHTKRMKEGYLTFVRGQEVQRINLIIINVYQLINQHVVDETIKIANQIQKEQVDIQKRIKKIGKID
jgi:hypothetical protein